MASRRRSAGCWPRNRLLGLARADYYREFGRRVDQLRAELKALLGQLKAQGCRIVAYGASAKESGLLNACGLGPDVIDFVVDRSAGKQGQLHAGLAPGDSFARQAGRELGPTMPCCSIGTRPTRFWPGTSAIAALAANSSSRCRGCAWREAALSAGPPLRLD